MGDRFKYRSVAVGGTFDHLHAGHIALLKRAFETGEMVFIGLTSDDFAARAGKRIDGDFEKRKSELVSFLGTEFPNRRYVITRLEKDFGAGIFTPEIEAVVVSSETLPKIPQANEKRKKLGLPDLGVEVVQLKLARDGGRISSTRIRNGEIDSEGNLRS